jgi:hypothetical protein
MRNGYVLVTIVPLDYLSSDNRRGEKSLLVEDIGRIRCNNVNCHERPYTRKS